MTPAHVRVTSWTAPSTKNLHDFGDVEFPTSCITEPQALRLYDYQEPKPYNLKPEALNPPTPNPKLSDPKPLISKPSLLSPKPQAPKLKTLSRPACRMLVDDDDLHEAGARGPTSGGGGDYK